MSSEILKFSLNKGILLDKDTLSLLSEFPEETAKEFIEKVSSFREKVITKSFFIKNAELINQLITNKKIIEKLKISLGLTLEISREIMPLNQEQGKKALESIRVLFSHANSTKKLEPSDFTKYFRARLSEMKQFLQEREELSGLTSINKINGQKHSLCVIGAVYQKRVTKNKNIILEFEDLTGKISILINKDKEEVYKKAKEALIDDIIAVKGFGDSSIIFANDIIYPDIFLPEKNFLDRDERAAFISDIHVGSKNFLEASLLKFISWLNGEFGDEKQKEEARKVKYLFVNGDNVDGVGVFPGQEELISIKDVKKQYEKLAELLGKIRKDIKIIMSPGQHDAVRVAEPQPAIGADYGLPVHQLENLILVSNPAVIEILNNGKKGIKILMYHGASMSSFVNEIETLRISKAHDAPSKVVKEILKRRHLAPIHSSVTYIPCEKFDPLLIREIPDIITTADFHRPDIDSYHNILIICTSCWQSITPFEEKVGNNPDPCKVPILNLKTKEIKILDFSGEEKDKECREEDEKMICEVKK